MPPPQDEVRLTNETLLHLETRIAAAVRTGISEAMNEDNAEKFWTAGAKVFRKQATEHTGKFVIGGLMGILRKFGLFLVLGGIVYAFGGWGALATLFKTLFYGSAP